jgi:hypothetical protein
MDSAWVTSAMVDSFAQAAPNAADQTVLVYACLGAGRISAIGVDVPDCPAGSVQVHWVADASGSPSSVGAQPVTSSAPGPSASSRPTLSASPLPSGPASTAPAPATSAPVTPAPSAPPRTSPAAHSAPAAPASPSAPPSTPAATNPGTSSPAPAGQTQCTTNQNGGANNNVTQLAGNTYHLQANEYNSGAPFTICTNGNPNFTISTSGVSVAHNGAPGAYPSIYKGCHWGYCTQNSGLPVPVSAMISTPGKVTTTFITSTNNNGAWDDSYDIWFNPAQSTSNNSSGLEMMIWLNHFGGTQPAGTAGPTVTIDGISFTVWYGGSGNGGTVSFVANNPVDSVSNLDLGPLAAYAVSKGYMQNSWYLIDVEAGFEPWTSGQGLTADSFNVLVH